jgi:hypothetical protein
MRPASMSGRLPGSQTKRRQLATQIGVDGYRLLQAVTHPQAPAWLRQIPAVDILRQVWIQQYTREGHGPEVIWRDADTHGLPPGRTMLVSPYDTDARYGEKRGHGWSGYRSTSARPATTPPTTTPTPTSHRT